MSGIFLGLMIASLSAADVGAAPQAELRYSGTLVPLSRDGEGAAVKQFSVYCLTKRDNDGERMIGFLVDERGGDGWPWPERFGTIKFDSQNTSTGSGRIQVLHNHNDSLYPLPVSQPLFEHAQRLAPDATWEVGETSYQVRGRRKLKDRDCWQVEASTGFRPRKMLQVEHASGLVVSAEERVVMGRGDEFLLKTELESAKALTEQEFKRAFRPLESLVALREAFKRPAGTARPELSDAELKSAATVLPQLEQEAAETPFDRLVAVIARDVKSQTERVENVMGLAQKFVGQPAPEFELRRQSGRPIALDEYAGKIVVLHFWSYSDDPLVEPYGQVGYLDFLSSRRGKLGVKVFGVAVDGRLSDAAKRAAALRQIQKLKDFMNIGYALAVDEGTLLETFGDPRRLGAKLPLWVVIDADGKVVHYHVGYYDVQPDKGLQELDDVIVKLIKRQRDAE